MAEEARLNENVAMEDEEAQEGAERQPPSGEAQSMPETSQPDGAGDVPFESAAPTASEETTEQDSEHDAGMEQQPPEQQQEAAEAGGEHGEEQAVPAADEQRPASGQAEPPASEPAQGSDVDGTSGPADGQGEAGEAKPLEAAAPEQALAGEHVQAAEQAAPEQAPLADQPEDLPPTFHAGEELPLDPTMLPTLSSSGMSIRQYLDTTVVPVLRLGLRELVKARPTDPFDFLADFIRDNKPK